ncbi:MAG: Na+/H+ antiporter subunit E [Xenophilus sp.]
MRRWLPSPPLSLALLVVWLLLNQSLHPATLAMGALLALAVPLLTRSLRPARVRMRHPGTALKLAAVVAHDLTVSAWAVARIILTRRTRDIDSRFVSVPLDLRDANGLAALSMIVCLTPGTAWHELAGDGSALLLHVLDLGDHDAFIAMVKNRYERPLMEIFEP